MDKAVLPLKASRTVKRFLWANKFSANVNQSAMRPV